MLLDALLQLFADLCGATASSGDLEAWLQHLAAISEVLLGVAACRASRSSSIRIGCSRAAVLFPLEGVFGCWEHCWSSAGSPSSPAWLLRW